MEGRVHKHEWLIRDTADEDLFTVARTMRDADAREVDASSGLLPFQALVQGYRLSARTWTLLIHGEPAAVFGVGELQGAHSFLTAPGLGCIWMLTTHAVDESPKAFLRACLSWKSVVLGLYPVLTNFIDARHERALRWAEWFGFKVYPAKPYGVSGLLFHPIVLTR